MEEPIVPRPSQSSSTPDDKLLVQDLSWKMLDGCIEEEEAEQLDLLLTHSEAARRAYVEIVQLHVDLMDKFGGLPRSEDLIKKVLDAKLADKNLSSEPHAGEIPKTEPTGA